MPQPRLSFVIGGAQKSGTTSLDAIFRQHPEIQMASVKETHFFDNENANWDAPNYTALDAYFAVVDQRLRGEATPITMYWRPAIRRIYRYNPDIKFIFLLRNPVERAFSAWRHEIAAGRETLTFQNAIREKGRGRLEESNGSEGLHRYVSYIERGLYAQQLEYLMQYFPANNIHCEISEDLFSDKSPCLRRISTFLEIEPFSKDICDVHMYAARDIVYPSQLEHRDRSYLAGVFCDDARRLQSILGRSINAWGNLGKE